MPMINCYVDDKTMERLQYASQQLGRTIEDLAESAIANEACHNDDRATKRHFGISGP